VVSDETKEKISSATKGKPHKGHKLSEETKLKIGEGQRKYQQRKREELNG